MTVNGCYSPLPQGGEIVNNLCYETLEMKKRYNKLQKFMTRKTQLLVHVTFYIQQQGKYFWPEFQ